MMTLRLAQLSDAPKMSELLTELAREHILPSCSALGGQRLLEAMNLESIKRYLTGPFRYCVAEQEGVLAGLVGMRDNRHLYHLFVANTHQGQGLARRLWDMAQADCLVRGNEGQFTVNSAINAQGVYLKLGFVALGGIREMQGIKDIPMSLSLKQSHCASA